MSLSREGGACYLHKEADMELGACAILTDMITVEMVVIIASGTASHYCGLYSGRNHLGD